MNKELRVCTIGGGSGMPIVNKALIRAGFTKIKSIVTTFDSGGDTGRLRTDERGRLLAFSDYWRALISIWDDKDGQKEIWQDMLRYRDGRGRNFGNTFFQFLSEKEGNLGEIDELFSKLTGAKLCGEVVPVSLNPSNVCFTTISGKTYVGENFIDDLRMSADIIDNIWLNPTVKANKKAIETIKSAELILVGPGTTYGSILPNFLPKGIMEAYKESKAKKIFLVNIFSTANEVKKANQLGYLEIFEKYLKNKKIFDLIVMADLSKLDKKMLKKVFYFYKLEHANLVKMVKTNKIKTIIVDVAKIEEKNMRLRHSEEKLGEFFKTLEI
ncbi:MAG: 2-phospho-L-lactate transferase CofD family protein [Candidatus Shapirobacteria bacterium]|jgi:uncharacterized cofD-like protein